MEYYQKLKNLREDADKHQEDIAKILGITRQQYSLYETGTREMKLNHRIKLCKYYRVSADYILGLPTGLPYGHSKTMRNDPK